MLSKYVVRLRVSVQPEESWLQLTNVDPVLLVRRDLRSMATVVLKKMVLPCVWTIRDAVAI